MNIEQARQAYEAECKKLGITAKQVTGMTRDMWSDDIELSSHDEPCICIMTADGMVLSVRHNVREEIPEVVQEVMTEDKEILDQLGDD